MPPASLQDWAILGPHCCVFQVFAMPISLMQGAALPFLVAQTSCSEQGCSCKCWNSPAHKPATYRMAQRQKSKQGFCQLLCSCPVEHSQLEQMICRSSSIKMSIMIAQRVCSQIERGLRIMALRFTEVNQSKIQHDCRLTTVDCIAMWWMKAPVTADWEFFSPHHHKGPQ